MADDLTKKLEGIIKELRDVMNERKHRISILRAEIDEMENSNIALEKQIQSMLDDF